MKLWRPNLLIYGSARPWMAFPIWPKPMLDMVTYLKSIQIGGFWGFVDLLRTKKIFRHNPRFFAPYAVIQQLLLLPQFGAHSPAARHSTPSQSKFRQSYATQIMLSEQL